MPVHRQVTKLCTRALTQHLPRHNIAVVLNGCNHNILLFPYEGSHAKSYGIDAIGNASCKDDFSRFCCIDVDTYIFANGFHRIGSALAQCVYTAVYIGIIVQVII